jgi:UDP-glucose 4-epimerase
MVKAFVTGGAGFIGSHLVEHLVARGDEVVVLDDLSSGRRSNLARLADSDRLRFVEGTILDAGLVDELTAECDQVFHLAAAVGVKMINEDPVTSLKINIHGTETVLESADRHRRPVLIASTSEVYGKNYSAPLRESDDRVLGSPWKSKWSYCEAKALDEFLGYVLWERTGLPVVSVRLFNTVGPRQVGRYGMVLPRFVDQALQGLDLTVYGDGQQSRCFGHVSDVVPGIVALSTNPAAYGKAVNLGGSHEDETTIAELAKRVITLTGSTSGIAHVPYEEAYLPGFEDVRRRVPCTDLARELIGYVPKMDLDAIITSVAEDRARAGADV